MEAKQRGRKEAKFSLVSGAVHYVHGLTTLHTVCMIIIPLFNTAQSSQYVLRSNSTCLKIHIDMCVCVCVYRLACLSVSELLSSLEECDSAKTKVCVFA